MLIEQEIQAIGDLLQLGHILNLSRHKIRAKRSKGKYLVFIGGAKHEFDCVYDAAEKYHSETRKACFNQAMEDASKTVASWPEWKRGLLGRLVD